LVKVSCKSVQPFLRMVVCYFCGEWKKQKKKQKTSVKHTHPPHRRLRKLTAYF